MVTATDTGTNTTTDMDTVTDNDIVTKTANKTNTTNDSGRHSTFYGCYATFIFWSPLYILNSP